MQILLNLFSWLCRKLPRPLALALGKGIGFFIRIALKRNEKICHTNMDIFFGQEIPSLSERKHLIKSMYCHFGKNLVEMFRLPQWSESTWDSLVTIEGSEHLIQAFHSGRGAIVIGAHLGFWDLAGAGAALKGGKVSFVIKTMRPLVIHQFWKRQFIKIGVHPIDKKNSLLEIIKRLKNGECIVFVIDQNMGLQDGIFVPFGSRQACTLKAPAWLARLLNIPVYASFSVRTQDDRFRWIISPPIETVHSTNEEQDIFENTKRFSAVVEAGIRKFPDQWIWMHRRWKNQPDGQGPVYAP